jgi:hypothetical protein
MSRDIVPLVPLSEPPSIAPGVGAKAGADGLRACACARCICDSRVINAGSACQMCCAGCHARAKRHAGDSSEPPERWW